MLQLIRIGLVFCLTLGTASVAIADSQVAVFAGGCFWGVDAVYRHVRGVSEVVSGYAGGSAATKPALYRDQRPAQAGAAEATVPGAVSVRPTC